MAFTVKLAKHNIQICGQGPSLQTFFKDYIVSNEQIDFSISCSEQEILSEQSACTENFSYEYIETLVILRKIAEILPLKNGFLFHGASISYQGKAYLFAAPSGTGKSTHIRLWRNYIGKDVGIINGDKPFITFNEPQPLVHGSPWAGKEKWQKNCSAPLNGICFIRQGTSNTIRKTSILESLPLLLNQIYMPQNEESAQQTLFLIDLLIKKVPLYLLECDMSEEAVRCSFEQLTGLPYPPKTEC